MALLILHDNDWLSELAEGTALLFMISHHKPSVKKRRCLPLVFGLSHWFFYSATFRRSLAAQQRARAKEALSQTKSLQSSMTAGKRALQVDLCTLSSTHSLVTKAL